MSTALLVTLTITLSLTSQIDPFVGVGLVYHESTFNPRAVNGSTGCCGLTAINPRFHDITNCADPIENLTLGLSYLNYCLELFGQDYRKALVAYNMGPWALKSRMAEYGNDWWWAVPFRTRKFAEQILSYRRNKEFPPLELLGLDNALLLWYHNFVAQKWKED